MTPASSLLTGFVVLFAGAAAMFVAAAWLLALAARSARECRALRNEACAAVHWTRGDRADCRKYREDVMAAVARVKDARDSGVVRLHGHDLGGEG